MYYWNHQTHETQSLKNELLNAKGVKKVRIATAYLSAEGVAVLDEMKQAYGLQKYDITVYLSAEFSSDKPHELLKRLSDICVVKIIFDRTFHPKVYAISGDENKVIYGSSNFTSGGLQKNIEFNYIGMPSESDLAALNKFFDFCDRLAVVVNGDVIEYYENNSSEIEKLNSAQRKLRSKLQGFVKKDDAFSESDYEIEDYYFTFEDYETFFVRNQKLNNKEITEKRRRVQEKMLKIHSRIYPQIKKLGISCHKREDNITSLINPCVYNHHTVAWNGVRYGKTPAEIDAFNFGSNKDDEIYGFQKHGCLQYCLVNSGFELNLFLAVKHDAWDRYHMHERLNALRPNIEEEIEKLQGYGMEWVVWDDELPEPFTFDFDTESPQSFCDFFKKYDRDGRTSCLCLYYEPDNEILEDFDFICEEVVEKIELLVPLYNAMVNRPKGTI